LPTRVSPAPTITTSGLTLGMGLRALFHRDRLSNEAQELSTQAPRSLQRIDRRSDVGI